MPLLNIRVTSNDEIVTIPEKFHAKHLHLKMIHVQLSAVVNVDNPGMEIELPFINHTFQVNSTSHRADLYVPLSTDLKCTTVYPDIPFAAAEVNPSFRVKLNLGGTGLAWEDADAVLKSCTIQFGYAKDD